MQQSRRRYITVYKYQASLSTTGHSLIAHGQKRDFTVCNAGNIISAAIVPIIVKREYTYNIQSEFSRRGNKGRSINRSSYNLVQCSLIYDYSILYKLRLLLALCHLPSELMTSAVTNDITYRWKVNETMISTKLIHFGLIF